MCPLLWCRESFENLASILQHVSVCSEVQSGWYWCPHCCRPEQFMGRDGPRSPNVPSQHSVSRKSSKLRRAVRFFKHLGHKKTSRGICSHQITDPCEDPFNGVFPKELDGSCRQPTELADSTADGFQSQYKHTEDEIQEIYTRPPHTFDDPEGHFHELATRKPLGSIESLH